MGEEEEEEKKEKEGTRGFDDNPAAKKEAHTQLEVVRTLYIIDPQGVVQMQTMYPQAVGRNFMEELRCLDALQLHEEYNHQVGTPANWNLESSGNAKNNSKRRESEVVILPNISDEDAQANFPGFRALKPYLRVANLTST